MIYLFLEVGKVGNFLAVQWLGLPSTFTAEGRGSVSQQGTKILQTVRGSKKKKKKKEIGKVGMVFQVEQT